ncbi:MAG: phosphonopyruvate decarboxylase [Treponema sp.]|nr:phosphonopyruvate decarboxylase [Treponema sp.]
MLDTRRFGEALKERGFDFYSGVPCSFLKDLINYAINECAYVMAANEGDAAAICAGAWLGGRKPALLMQNSGLGNAVSPLTSLHAVFHIPVLGFVSLRGEPGLEDEPQHELMGPITAGMLDTMGIDHAVLAPEDGAASAQLAEAEEVFSQGRPFFFIVKKNAFSPVSLKEGKAPPLFPDRPRRFDLLQRVVEAAPKEALFLATTGFTGRELYTLGDGPNKFYMAGSLGCVSSLGLGLSLARPDKPVIVLDGDGSLLMRAGSLGVNAYYRPRSLCHILFNNGAHESTGGQFTVSGGVDYPLLARAFGYPQVFEADSPDALGRLVEDWGRKSGLCFIHAPAALGTIENLGRPRIKPPDETKRLRRLLGSV